MDITDSIFEDSLSNGGNNDFMEGGEPLSNNFPFPLQFQLPDFPFPEDFLDLAPRPQAMPVINPFSVRENFINEQVVAEIEMERPGALTAEEIVDGYLPTRDTHDQFSRLHVMVCGFCHSVFHVVDEFNSHLRKCSGVKTNSSCSDESASALALVLWSNTIHRKLKPSLAHLSGTDSLANTIQQKWFRLSKKTKLVWVTAARSLQQLGKTGKLVFPGVPGMPIRDAGSRPNSGSSGGYGHGWPETWRSPVDLGQEDEIQQEMVQLDTIKKEVIELDTVVDNQVQPLEAVRTSSRIRKVRRYSSDTPEQPELTKPGDFKHPHDFIKASGPRKTDKREKWKQTERNNCGRWSRAKQSKDNPEETMLRCETCDWETMVVSKMKRHIESIKHKRLVPSKDETLDAENCEESNEEDIENIRRLVQEKDERVEMENCEEEFTKKDVENIRKMVVDTEEAVETVEKENCEESNKEDLEILRKVVMDEDETAVKVNWEGESNSDKLENISKVKDARVDNVNCEEESRSDDVENIRLMVGKKDEAIDRGNFEEDPDSDNLENILEVVEDSDLMEADNSSMNIATPPCDIIPVSLTPDAESSPIKKKKFKLFNHPNEPSMEGIESLSQGSNRKVVTIPILNRKDKNNKILELNSSFGNSSGKSDLVREKSFNTVGGIDKQPIGNSLKVKTTRVDPVLKDKTDNLVKSKRKSALAAKGKVSSWAQGYSIEESVQKKGKDALKVSVKGERKGVMKDLVLKKTKSSVSDYARGNRNNSYKDFLHINRVQTMEGSIQQEPQSAIKNCLHGKRKSAIAAQGKVSCWALGQSLEERQAESPSKKIKSSHIKPASKSKSYFGSSIGKLNKISMSAVSGSDLPKITVEKVKIDEGTLKKLQLDLENGRLKAVELANSCVHKNVFNVPSDDPDLSFDCVGGKLPLSNQPLRDELVLNSSIATQCSSQDRTSPKDKPSSSTKASKSRVSDVASCLDRAKTDTPDETTGAAQDVTLDRRIREPGELQLSGFFHFQTTTPDERVTTILNTETDSQEIQKSSYAISSILIRNEESHSSRSFSLPPPATVTPLSSTSSILLDKSSRSETARSFKLPNLPKPSISSSIVSESSPNCQTNPSSTHATQDTRPRPTVLSHRRPGHQAKVETEKLIQLGGEGPSNLAQATAQSQPAGLGGDQKNKFQPLIVAKKSLPPREPGELSLSSVLRDPHLRIKTRVPTTAQTVHDKYAYHEGIHLLKPEVIVASKPAKTIVSTVRIKPFVDDEARSLAACLPKGFEMVKQQTEGKTEFCLRKKPQFPITANVNQPKTIQLGEPKSSISASRRFGKPNILQHQIKPNQKPSELPSQSFVPTAVSGSLHTTTRPILEKRLGQTVEKINIEGKISNVYSQVKQASHSVEANNPDLSFDAVGGRLPLTDQPIRDEMGLLEQESYIKVLPISKAIKKDRPADEAQNKLIFIESPIAFHKSMEAIALANSKLSANTDGISFCKIPGKPSATVMKRIQSLGAQQFTDGGTSKMLIELPGGNKMVADLTKDQLKHLNISFPNQAENCSLSQVLAPDQNIQTPKTTNELETRQPPNLPLPYGIRTPGYTADPEGPDLGEFSSHQLFESAMKEPPVVGPGYYKTASPKGGNKDMSGIVLP